MLHILIACQAHASRVSPRDSCIHIQQKVSHVLIQCFTVDIIVNCLHPTFISTTTANQDLWSRLFWEWGSRFATLVFPWVVFSLRKSPSSGRNLSLAEPWRCIIIQHKHHLVNTSTDNLSTRWWRQGKKALRPPPVPSGFVDLTSPQAQTGCALRVCNCLHKTLGHGKKTESPTSHLYSYNHSTTPRYCRPNTCADSYNRKENKV